MKREIGGWNGTRMQNKSIDVVCLVSSDKGFKDVIEECRKKGERVVVIN